MANPLPETCSNRSCIRAHIRSTANSSNNNLTPLGSQVSLVTLVAGPKALGTLLAMYLNWWRQGAGVHRQGRHAQRTGAWRARTSSEASRPVEGHRDAAGPWFRQITPAARHSP